VEKLIVLLFQVLFDGILLALEFAIDVPAYAPLDWLFDWRDFPEPRALWLACLLWFAGGCVLAWLSILLLTHTFIALPALRVANLAIAPIASAFLSQALARRRKKKNAAIVPRNHFWQSFWFTLGLVTVRFAFAVRG